MVRPNKGTKRKSESPETEENVAATRKRYSTRSSNRKRMSYNESDDESNQPPVKIACSSEDDDFLIQDEETKGEEETVKSSPTSSETDKRNSKCSVTKPKNTFKRKSAKILPQVPIHVGFKPVHYNISKLKSELDLSDSSDSETSMEAEDCTFTENLCKMQNQEKTHCTPSKSVLVEELNIVSPTGISPWIQNLNALKNEVYQENEPIIKTEVIPKKSRGKKLKPTPSKKINKCAATKKMVVQPKEISIAEMLKEEKVQDPTFSSEDDDENWERVKASPCVVPEQDRELPKSVEITLEVSGLKNKKKGLDMENLIRLKINRIRREIQLV